MPVIVEIARERERQIGSEGFDYGHDDQHTRGELATAAACYALGTPTLSVVTYWPWEKSWWKPKDRRRDLIRAAALIVAEVERLDRLAAKLG
jgi:hypothetical protein